MKIAITGRFRTGKDTVAGIIARSLVNETTRLAFADALKEELAAMSFNYIYAWRDVHPRESMRNWTAHMNRLRGINGVGWQWWGEFRRQHDDENYWVTHPAFQSRYELAVRWGENIIITDMRHHNEAAWCRGKGFYLIRVEGPCRSEETRDPGHPSEIHVHELPVNLVLKNNGSMNDLTKGVLAMLANEVAEFFAE